MTVPISPYVAGLEAYQPGKPIEETKRELGLDDVIKLASNENPRGPSPKAVAAMQRALTDLNLYPDGSGFRLKKALAAFHGVSIDQLMLGNGSNELLELIVRTVAEPGCNIVFGWPSFIVYPLSAQSTGMEPRRVAMPNFHYDVDELLAAVDSKTRAVLIGSPSNPTGTYIPKAGLERLVNELPENVLLVIDEAYFEYVDAPDYVSGLTLMRPNVIVLRTFSKAYGLAGMRLGYGIGDARFVAFVNRLRAPFNVNSLALVGAEAALGDREHINACVTENRIERERVCAALKSLGLGVVPTQTNFVLVDFNRPALPIYDALLKRGVIARPLKPYDLMQHLRISFGLPAQNDRLIEALTSILGD